MRRQCKHVWSEGVLVGVLVLVVCASGFMQPGQSHASSVTYATTITVNSAADPDTSDGTNCSSGTCTLRRAVIQARNLRADQKPVLINFNIPAIPAEGYDSDLQIWKIQFSGISSVGGASLRQLNGDIHIDGSTQPGGRTTGPKIILVGAGTGQHDGIKLGEHAAQGGNVIRGLGFQNFRTHIHASSHENVIENNWFGLSDDGSGIVLRGGGASDGSGNTGVSVGANLVGNIIEYNVFSGLAGVAAAINGNDTIFAANFIGTTADGTVPEKETDPDLICRQWDWLGGSGISLSGSGNTVEDNIFAGLRINVAPPTIQADTIRMGGSNHTIRNNKIGLDAENNEIGVCGRGVYLQSGTKFNRIDGNQIYQPGLSAISLNDSPTVSTSDANTLRGNVIVKDTPWGQQDGISEPEGAIQLGPAIHAAFRNFMPARVESIDGVTVRGGAGENSACPDCIIELFRDDRNNIVEALESLAVVTADADGNWTATLAAPLSAGQAIRTTSTTGRNNTISGMSAGTTTPLSELYAFCEEGSQCDAGQGCVGGVCVDGVQPECVHDADCREGFVCDSGFCVEAPQPECAVDADCAAGESCVGGRCVISGVDDCTLNIMPPSVRSSRLRPLIRMFRISGTQGFDPGAEVVIGEWNVPVSIPAGSHVLVLAIVPPQLESAPVAVSVGECTGQVDIR